MAQPQVIDISAMHRIGYAAAGGDRRYKPARQTSALEKFAFQFLGNQVLNYVHAAKTRKQAYQDKNLLQNEEINATISEENFGPDIENAIKEFSEQRNKGQRIVSNNHGFANSKVFKGRAKKYAEGVTMMNQAQARLKNLQADLTSKLTWKNRAKSVELNGYYIDAEGKKVEAKWDDNRNEGPVKNRGYALIDGSLDKSFYVDRETGNLTLAEENYDHVSIMPGSYNPSDRQDHDPTVEGPRITKTPWNELQLPKFKDPSGAAMSTNASTYGTGLGNDGLGWDDILQAGTYDMARQEIDGLSRDGFNSWFFNGTHYNFASGGKTFTTPAEAFIKKNYEEIYTKMQEGDVDAKVQYEGILEGLRTQNLSEIDGYREFAVDHYVDIARQYHGIAKAAYDKKHAKDPKVIKQTQWEYERQLNTNKAVAMMSGKNTQYDTINGKDYKFRSDGNGITKVFIKQKIEEEGKPPTFKYVPFGNPMYTEDALKFRGLDQLIPAEYMPETFSERSERMNREMQSKVNASEFIYDPGTKKMIKNPNWTGKSLDVLSGKVATTFVG